MGLNIAVIPARGGSKGIPRKNMKLLAGKPLVQWTIEAAQRTTLLDQIIVSSDDDEILELSLGCGVLQYLRPSHLAGDNIHAIHVVMDCLELFTSRGLEVDTVAMLLPTAPLRTEKDIESAFEILDSGYASSVIGVCKSNKPESNFRYIGDNNILRPILPVHKYEVQRQDIPDPVYEVNGAMFMATRKHLEVYKSFHEGNPAAYIMNKINSIDINDLDDFEMVEALICRR